LGARFAPEIRMAAWKKNIAARKNTMANATRILVFTRGD
jgi:hypothetical protein